MAGHGRLDLFRSVITLAFIDLYVDYMHCLRPKDIVCRKYLIGRKFLQENVFPIIGKKQRCFPGKWENQGRICFFFPENGNERGIFPESGNPGLMALAGQGVHGGPGMCQNKKSRPSDFRRGGYPCFIRPYNGG